MLGEPVAVIAELLGDPRERDRIADSLARRDAGADGREIEHR
jgi:hypothetical protein